MATQNPMLQYGAKIWEMLDELAEKDPKSYENLINSHLSEANQFLPEPGFSVIVTKGIVISFYINFCSSPQVDAPTRKDGQPYNGSEPFSKLIIPLSVGNIRDFSSSSPPYHVCDIIVNSSVIERALLDHFSCQIPLIDLAISFINQDHKINLFTQYKIIDSQYYGIGPLPIVKDDSESKSKTPDIIIPRSEDKPEKTLHLPSHQKPSTLGSGPLIEHQPSYDLIHQHKKNRYVIIIEIPSATSLNDINLLMSKNSINIKAPSYYNTINLFQDINTSLSTAVFDPSLKQLLIKAPICTKNI